MGRAQTLTEIVKAESWTRGAELGVWKGATTKHLLKHVPELVMIGVDRWKPMPGTMQNRETGEAPYTIGDMQVARNDARGVWLRFKQRLFIMEMDTVAAAQHIKPASLDFVFVDADHATEAVVADVTAWLPKIRRGGAMLGHDLNWPSVQRALQRLDLAWDELPDNIWHSMVP